MKKNRKIIKKLFSYFKKIQKKSLYKPSRKINFNKDNFYPIFKIDSQTLTTSLNREDYKKLSFLPFLSYNLYFLTNLSLFSISNLLGIPFYFLFSLFLSKINDHYFFSKIQKLEIKKNFEELKFTPFFCKGENKSVIVKKEDIIDIKKIEVFNTKHIDLKKNSLKFKVLIDGKEHDFDLGFGQSEFDGYLDYLDKLAEKKNVFFN